MQIFKMLKSIADILIMMMIFFFSFSLADIIKHKKKRDISNTNIKFKLLILLKISKGKSTIRGVVSFYKYFERKEEEKN